MSSSSLINDQVLKAASNYLLNTTVNNPSCVRLLTTNYLMLPLYQKCKIEPAAC